ncbi:hypothetical protein QBC47DRAFT_391184 [Echria macrotheca]|uniref:Uncharacterized protein n=1 Tax=Echria macrotheca TaxID=438768 RepID=A0AAJ0B6Y1_9PEZI|nr:hypothetical protein QBC47DRAFT_391184 [Echria macrotheca]
MGVPLVLGWLVGSRLFISRGTPAAGWSFVFGFIFSVWLVRSLGIPDESRTRMMTGEGGWSLFLVVGMADFSSSRSSSTAEGSFLPGAGVYGLGLITSTLIFGWRTCIVVSGWHCIAYT